MSRETHRELKMGNHFSQFRQRNRLKVIKKTKPNKTKQPRILGEPRDHRQLESLPIKFSHIAGVSGREVVG